MNDETLKETAQRMWPEVPYDAALPQAFVDKCAEVGFDPRGCVIWGYPKRCLFGMPLPLSEIAMVGIVSAAHLQVSMVPK